MVLANSCASSCVWVVTAANRSLTLSSPVERVADHRPQLFSSPRDVEVAWDVLQMGPKLGARCGRPHDLMLFSSGRIGKHWCVVLATSINNAVISVAFEVVNNS